MIMILPFLLGLAGIVFVLVGWRVTAMVSWVILVVVLGAWLNYHATSSLGLTF